MGIQKNVKAVKGLFHQLDKEIDQFKTRSGLNCLAGCGSCCHKPDIEATILEFLPLAIDLYQKGQVDEVLDLINSNEDGRCVIFSPFLVGGTTGFCSNYSQRGLICRLFGFSATRDKNGIRNIATCKKIKEAMPELFQKANTGIQNGDKIPGITNYYSKLQAIDLNIGGKMYPINQAIKWAIETVALYFYYKNPRAS